MTNRVNKGNEKWQALGETAGNDIIKNISSEDAIKLASATIKQALLDLFPIGKITSTKIKLQDEARKFFKDSWLLKLYGLNGEAIVKSYMKTEEYYKRMNYKRREKRKEVTTNESAN